MGDLGGLDDFIMLLGWSLSYHIAGRLFSAALVKQAYRVQKYLKDKTPYYRSNKDDGKLTTESDSNDGESAFKLASPDKSIKANQSTH